MYQGSGTRQAWRGRAWLIGAFALVSCSPAPATVADVASAADTADTPDAAPLTDLGPPLPARICKKPSAGITPAFTEATAEFGLAQDGTLEPVAHAIAAADLDGDGFADLFTTSVTSHRTTTDTNWKDKQLRFLFMSRPDPARPGKRTFVDTLADSGLLATRDGKGNRGWGLAALGDLDNDGDTDAILCPTDEVSPGNVPEDACDALLNDGKGHFTLAPASDLGKKTFWVPGGVLFDYDRDGNLDFWPATVAHWPYNPSDPNTPPTLFRGHGEGTFTKVAMDVGFPQ